MSYFFYSQNSDLHFSINDEKMFHKLMSYVEDSLKTFDVDINVRDIVTELVETKCVYIDKQTTKIMCRTLEKDNNSICECEYLNHLLDDEFDSKKTRIFYIILMMNFIRFIKFIKNTRSGFTIFKIEKTENHNEKLLNHFFSESVQ